MTPTHFQIIPNLHQPPRNSSVLSGTSYLCTLATPMFPKCSPSVVKTLSVLPSVREYSGYGQDPLANDHQGALDDYDDPHAFQNKSPLNHL